MIALSGNLADARGLDDRGSTLALRKTRGLLPVGVDAAELLSVSVIDGDKIVVVLPPPVLAESALLFAGRLFRRRFFHCDYSCTGRSIEALSQGTRERASTMPARHVHCTTMGK
jgi:hypothetical protein